MASGCSPATNRASIWWRSGACWHFVRKRAGLAPDEHGHAPRTYDLRHSFASIGAGGGLSLPIIGRLLGHSQSAQRLNATRTLADDPLREAAEKITTVIAASIVSHHSDTTHRGPAFREPSNIQTCIQRIEPEPRVCRSASRFHRVC